MGIRGGGAAGGVRGEVMGTVLALPYLDERRTRRISIGMTWECPAGESDAVCSLGVPLHLMRWWRQG